MGPQIPSLQLLLKVRLGSISFLILMRASSTMGPQSLRFTLYSSILGLSPGFSGSHLFLGCCCLSCSPYCCGEGRAGGEAEKLGCCVDCHGSSCTTDSLLELVLEVPGSVFDCLQAQHSLLSHPEGSVTGLLL